MSSIPIASPTADDDRDRRPRGHRPRSRRPHDAHPAGRGRTLRLAAVTPAADQADPGAPTATGEHPEDGSLVTEYGLLVVVAATIAGVVINWASNGQIVTLFNALLRQARSLVGA
jgi:hypothetical protein